MRITQAMDCDWEMPRVPVDGHGFSATAEDLHRVWKDEFLRYARKRVMIAADDEDANCSLMKPSDLLGQKTGRLHRRLIAIIKIACQNQRIDTLFQAEIDDAHKGQPRGVPNQVGKIGIAQGKRTQWGIEVDIRSMDKTIRHSDTPVERCCKHWSHAYRILNGRDVLLA